MRNAIVWLGLSAIVATLLSQLPSRAEACGMCTESFAPTSAVARLAPLPASPRILVAGEGLDVSSIELMLDDDAGPGAVSFSVEATGSTDGSVFVLPTDLPAGETLIVRSNVGEARYQTGDQEDATAPTPPDVEVFSAHLGGACCASVSSSFTATAASDGGGEPPAVLKVRLRSEAGDRAVFFGYQPGMHGGLGTSEEGCVATDPLAVDGEEVSAEFSVLDWAGNESDVVGPLPFVYSSGEPGGCGMVATPFPSCRCVSTSPSSASAGLFLLGLLGFGIVGRRGGRAGPWRA